MALKNRFVASACEDNLADDRGWATNAVIRKHRKLAEGDVGLIISSHLSVQPSGRTRIKQLGIHNDQMIPGLHQLAKAVHEAEGKIVFQLGHAGLGTKQHVIGRLPMGPSGGQGEMDGGEIRETIKAFGRAAERAVIAGADGIQIHAAHGYLINEFLSPFFNQRRDDWGGSEENSFRMLGSVIREMRHVMPDGMPLLVKLNAHDHTPQAGITPPLAAQYTERLAAMGIDGLEVSCGTSVHSPWNMCRGDIPVKEILQNLPEERKARVEATLEKIKNKFEFAEGYNLEHAVLMRPAAGHMPLFAVGGWRHLRDMEEAVAKGATDLIALCRPLIREPALVRKFREGKTCKASCTSCNRCLMALAGQMPVRCHLRS